MNTLTEALKILASNSKDETKPARDFMSAEQREALAEDFAAKNNFISAAHFTTCADKKIEFETMFREYVRTRNH